MLHPILQKGASEGTSMAHLDATYCTWIYNSQLMNAILMQQKNLLSEGKLLVLEGKLGFFLVGVYYFVDLICSKCFMLQQRICQSM